MHDDNPASGGPAAQLPDMSLKPSATELFRRKLAGRPQPAELRRIALDGLASSPALESTRHAQIGMLVTHTDRTWWDGLLGRALAEQGLELTGKWSRRLVSSAGNAAIRGSEAVIQVSHFIVRETHERNRWPIRMQGLDCPNATLLIQLIVEHELAHVAEYAATGKMRGHGPAFREIAGSQFGHTEFAHNLVTARQKALDEGIRPGMRVTFVHEGTRYWGKVVRITKRATVITEGRTRMKCYVPIGLLEAASVRRPAA